MKRQNCLLQTSPSSDNIYVGLKRPDLFIHHSIFLVNPCNLQVPIQERRSTNNTIKVQAQQAQYYFRNFKGGPGVDTEQNVNSTGCSICLYHTNKFDYTSSYVTDTKILYTSYESLTYQLSNEAHHILVSFVQLEKCQFL